MSMTPVLSARQERIVEILRATPSITTADLALRLGVSGETVRRDLQAMADDGIVQKFHGGVSLHRDVQESPFQLRLRSNVAAKRRLAQQVCALLPDGATRLLVTAYIGIGNRLFIRGDAPGLSPDKGIPLQFVSIGKWRWETTEARGAVRHAGVSSTALTWERISHVARPISFRLPGCTLVIVLPTTRPRLAITPVECALISIFSTMVWSSSPSRCSVSVM